MVQNKRHLSRHSSEKEKEKEEREKEKIDNEEEVEEEDGKTKEKKDKKKRNQNHFADTVTIITDTNVKYYKTNSLRMINSLKLNLLIIMLQYTY